MGQPARQQQGVFEALSASWEQLPASLRAKITWTPMALEQVLVRLVEEPLTEALALEIGAEVHHQVSVVMSGLQEYGGFLELVVSLARSLPTDGGQSLESTLIRLDILSEMRMRWLDRAFRSLTSLPMRWLFYEVGDVFGELQTEDEPEDVPPPFAVTAIACRLATELTLTRRKPISRLHDLCEMATAMAARWMETARDVTEMLRSEDADGPDLQYFEAIWNQVAPHYETYQVLKEALTLVKRRERPRAIEFLEEHIQNPPKTSLLQDLLERLQTAYVIPVYRGQTTSGLTSKQIDDFVAHVDQTQGAWLALTTDGITAQGHTLKEVHERIANSTGRPLLIQLRTT